MISSDETIAIYNSLAVDFADKFEAFSSAAIWSDVRDLRPVGDNRFALDVGAGSGRDAAWLASLGMTVMAAEPAAGLRCEGMARHEGEIRWIDDRLPDLAGVHRLGLSFDVILLSAVWMHLSAIVRPRAFRKMVTLLKPGGVLLMSLR